jgi:DnaJ family protein C protein 19
VIKILFWVLLAGFIWWLWRRSARRGSPVAIDAARRLLEVAADADRETVQAAHRRLITRVHPDAGGSAELTRQVNAARDALLADLDRRVKG